MRLVAAPKIEASGVRKSWLIEAKSVLRTRSVSAAARAAFTSSASRARSSGGPRLVPGTAGDRRGEDRNREQDEKRQPFMRLGDREGVQRLDEEEIVGEERQSRGEKRRPQAEARGGKQHREQEHHREVREANE